MQLSFLHLQADLWILSSTVTQASSRQNTARISALTSLTCLPLSCPTIPNNTTAGRHKECVREMFNVQSRTVHNSSINSSFDSCLYLANKRESWQSNQGILALEPTFYPLVMEQFPQHLISKCKSSLCQIRSLAFSQVLEVFFTRVPIYLSKLTSQYFSLVRHFNGCVPYMLKFHSSEMTSFLYCCSICKSLLA